VEIAESHLRRDGEADFLPVPAVTRFTALFKKNNYDYSINSVTYH
jgi:hypothetical protein